MQFVLGKQGTLGCLAPRFISVETSFCCAVVASRCTEAVSGGTVAPQDRGYIYFCFVQLHAHGEQATR